MTMRSVFATMTVALFTSAALAQCTAGAKTASAGEKPHCSGDKVVLASASEKAACSGEKAMASKKCAGDVAKACMAGAPCMKYTVGEKTTCCPEEAAKLAGDDKAQIKYVVGEKSYDNEAEAKKALAAALDGYLAQMLTVRYAVGDETVACPMTASTMAKSNGGAVRYRLASFDFENKAAAEAAATAAKRAAEGVTMNWKVGDKSYCCSSTAASMAKKENKPVEYCVGEKTTACSIDAGVALAQSKIAAAVAALEKAAQG